MKNTERSAGLLIAGITSVEGPIIRVEDTGIVAYDEFVEIIDMQKMRLVLAGFWKLARTSQ